MTALWVFLGFYFGAGFATMLGFAIDWERSEVEVDGMRATRLEYAVTFALWWLALWVEWSGDDS